MLRREELYWALHAVLVKRPQDFEVFDQAFRLFWRDPLGARTLARLLPQPRIPRSPTISRRVAEAWRPPAPAGTAPTPASDQDDRLGFSPAEVLRTRDFEQMSAEELTRAKRVVARMALVQRPVRTRRFAPAPTTSGW